MYNTSKLNFKNIAIKDANFTFALRNENYENNKMMVSTPLPSNISKERAWIKSLNTNKNHAYFIIQEKKTSAKIGYCFLNDIDYLHRYGYIGLMIKSEYQGMGYGKITISFLCNLAKKNLNLIKVQASVVSLNTKSAQLFKKCSFKLEGKLKKNFFIKGKRYDHLIFGKKLV